jgi:hypothetical protein
MSLAVNSSRVKKSYPGIVHYKSYQGNLGGAMLPVSDAAVYNFEGAQLQKEYLRRLYTAWRRAYT